jgi:glycosyltransferase involved in cell wall biosynthesis
MKKISICIPTWNRYELTIRSIDLVKDDERVSEIVIVDDCSTDDSFLKLKNYCDSNPKFKLYKNDKNLDCYRNKQKAVSLSTNDWCILLDSDNIIDLNYLDTLYNIGEWDSNSFYLPTFAKPHFDYRKYNDYVITSDNVNAFTNDTVFLTALNTCNFFINKNTYLKIWDSSVDPVTADSIYVNYCALLNGVSLRLIKNLEYDHSILKDSHYVNNNHRTGSFYNDLLQKFKNISDVASTTLMGRIGNQFYQIAMLLAYSKKHGIKYQIPTTASNCDNNKVYFDIQSTGKSSNYVEFFEDRPNDSPTLMSIPKLKNPKFNGYWQTFEYFDEYRDYILSVFKIPVNKLENVVSVHVRRGDFLEHPNKHPYLGIGYYQNAINFFRSLGYSKFMVFSDDIDWCENNFNKSNFENVEFIFSKNKSELEDLTLMSNCEHNIVAMSSFSFTAAWLNTNPNKIIVCPERKYLFGGSNNRMVPSYFKEIQDTNVGVLEKHTHPFLNNVYCSYVNLDSRPDRNLSMINELKKVNINAIRTRGLLPNEVNQPYDKIAVMQKRTPGAIGCHFSQISVMQNALKLNKHALVLEDDLVFCEDFNDRLNDISDFLENNDWDVFWLGGTYHIPAQWHDLNHTNSELKKCDCNLGTDAEPTHVKEIVRTYGCWSTYAYIVNKDKLNHILDLLDCNVYQSIGIDWLFIKLQPILKTYAYVPGCVKQYDNQSNIGKGVTVFSAFSNLGNHWYQDKKDNFDYESYHNNLKKYIKK